MADNSWRNLERWERVKWARRRRYDSAAAAAEALGMKEGTYRCYERGPDSAKSIPLEYQHARRFADLFRVRWEWLLDGAGAPLAGDEASGAGGDFEDVDRAFVDVIRAIPKERRAQALVILKTFRTVR